VLFLPLVLLVRQPGLAAKQLAASQEALQAASQYQLI